jgi:membrane protease YdiL (CAAX protease family)
MLRSPYSAHEILVGPARVRPELWRLPAGVILILGLSFILGGAMNAVLEVMAPGLAASLEQDGAVGGTPAALLILLGGFIVLTVATATAVRLLHRRSLGSVLGPQRALIRDFLATSKGLAVLLAVLWVLVPYDTGAPLEPNLAPGPWLMLLPLSLIAVLIQTSAEEIVFRGYLQQQLAARFSSPFVWMLVPSALFAVGHYLPVEAGDNAIYIVVWAGLFGVLMADLTARAGNLGPAIAVHFANNVSSLLIVSLPDMLDGLSLYTIDVDIASRDALVTIMPIDFVSMILMWLVARIAIRA